MESFLKEKWNFLKINSQGYILKFVNDETSYSLLVFNLTDCALYHERKNLDEIDLLMKTLNASIEAPANKLIQHLKQSLYINPEACKFEAIREQGACCPLLYAH
jgi:hypothetical protein